VAPTCSNCGASDFVWANELKTGSTMTGTSTLSLRAKGEIPLGTRICRGCGHADLFLRDISVLQRPHLWKPGEFVPIPSKPAAKPAAEPVAPAPHAAHASHAPPMAPPPPPAPAPVYAPPPPAPPAAPVMARDPDPYPAPPVPTAPEPFPADPPTPQFSEPTSIESAPTNGGGMSEAEMSAVSPAPPPMDESGSTPPAPVRPKTPRKRAAKAKSA
jgi:hypothetical protein